jgi:regulator of protease activity HflC (stomatin/prohibitin superfamily)
MAEISKYPFFYHIRSNPNEYVLKYSKGKLVASGRGTAFWFRPLSTSIAMVPVDDAEIIMQLSNRSADHQSIIVEAVLSFRVIDAIKLAERINFSVDIRNASYLDDPKTSLRSLVTQLTLGFCNDYFSAKTLDTTFKQGASGLRSSILDSLTSSKAIADLGLEIVSFSVNAIKTSADIEKAMQTPTREMIQQKSDEAIFQRRAVAVEKERVIAENELATKIEIAAREAKLIAQEGANQIQRVEEAAKSEKIKADSQAAISRVDALAKAEQVKIKADGEAYAIDLTETARLEAEKKRNELYENLSESTQFNLVLQEAFKQLSNVDSISVSTSELTDILAKVFQQSRALNKVN